METLKTGSKAFFDSYSGLIPCVVTAIKAGPRGYGGEMESWVTFKLTAERHGYKKGETLSFSAGMVVPRKAVYRSRQACGQYRIREYRVQIDWAFDFGFKTWVHCAPEKTEAALLDAVCMDKWLVVLNDGRAAFVTTHATVADHMFIQLA